MLICNIQQIMHPSDKGWETIQATKPRRLTDEALGLPDHHLRSTQEEEEVRKVRSSFVFMNDRLEAGVELKSG